jgi:predicted regulator of Ras-like GTPase activity (Roadblock/LC7/MglB family)
MIMPGELEAILNDMKAKGIGGAVVRVDGVPVASTIALNDINAGLFASIANISDALMKKMNDHQKEVEIAFDGLILVLIPLKNHIFCGMVKDREEKKIVLEYAQKAKAYV